MTDQLVIRSEDSVILYDASKADHIEAEMFSPDYWPDAKAVPGYSGGRGATLLVTRGDRQWVVKHYYRGGLVGRFLRDRFLYTGQRRTRSVVEYEVLRSACAQKLPVPVPVAAYWCRKGLVYEAGLITERIPNVEPFSARLIAGPVSDDVWQSVGICIRRFHDAGFCHADLSAHNLQIAEDDAIWLLDWDRGCQRPAGRWQQGNLARLLRSCRKISVTDQAQFSSANWQALLAGYAAEPVVGG